ATLASSAADPDTTPHSASPWPPRYLVALWIDSEAPRSTGRCRSGVANVASTSSGRPCARHSSASPSTSATRNSGFEIDSTNRQRPSAPGGGAVAPPAPAAPGVGPTPNRGRGPPSSSCVRPYNRPPATTRPPAAYASIAAAIAPIPDENTSAASAPSRSATA